MDSNAELYLKPLMIIDEKIDYNDYNIIENNDFTKLNNHINYTISLVHKFVNNSLDKNDKYLISDMNIRHCMAIHAINECNLNNSTKMCVIIASMLSVFDNHIIDHNQFINVFDKDRELINEMMNLIYNKKDGVSYWKLIPRYITIINKINQNGILKFVKDNSYDEIKNFMNIVNNYNYNYPNNYIRSVFNSCIRLIKNINFDVNTNLQEFEELLF
jgi:hypothetical protein